MGAAGGRPSGAAGVGGIEDRMAKQANDNQENETREESGDGGLGDVTQAAVKKMVARAKERGTLTYDELLEMPLFEQYVTIACVSNRVGDDLIGNALWTGVDLREVLDMAGVQPAGEQIVGRSVDGFTAGFPTSWAMDPARRPMIAIGMNGQPLPRDHGYPARLIIPQLYAWKSAKWIGAIELIPSDNAGFWERNGYHMNGDPWREERFGGWS